LTNPVSFPFGEDTRIVAGLGYVKFFDLSAGEEFSPFDPVPP
jgi:hypothetical protein